MNARKCPSCGYQFAPSLFEVTDERAQAALLHSNRVLVVLQSRVVELRNAIKRGAGSAELLRIIDATEEGTEAA